MDTRLLQTFMALARTGSFTAAAAELRVVQSTVTSHIKALEGELDVRLFDRLPQGARLTDAGRRVATHARDLLDVERRLHDSAGSGGTIAGEVVIGATESLCAYLLPQVISALATTHPDIQVHLKPLSTANALQGLGRPEGGLDIALLLDDDVATEYAARTIGGQAIELVAAAGHPAAGGHHDWQDLAAHQYFLLEEGCSYTDRFLRDLTAASATRPRITRFGSIEAARSCVAAGLGLSVLPRLAVVDQLANGSLCRVNGPELAETPLHLVTNQRRWASPAVTTTAEAIAQAGRQSR
ncbi:LysR family transcriptional regulator [Saccharopolyspora shandongensis]|uniref:LysR family transcriptional regulator n=1 Tax=Saccharopolyspora shandongensis TaxID=418495 RepID=UPI0033E3EA4B